MDSNSSNDDDEPKICTVFSSAPSNSKSVFDTIAFSNIPRKDVKSPDPVDLDPASLLFPSSSNYHLEQLGVNSLEPASAMSKTGSMVSILADDLQSGDSSAPIHVSPTESTFTGNDETTTMATSHHLFALPTEESDLAKQELPNKNLTLMVSSFNVEENHEYAGNSDFLAYKVPSVKPDESLGNPYPSETWQDYTETLDNRISEKLEVLQIKDDDQNQTLPAAKSLFEDAPEVSFPINIGFPETNSVPLQSSAVIESIFYPVTSAPLDTGIVDYSSFPTDPGSASATHIASNNYTPVDASYDAWISSVETSQIIKLVQAGSYFPEATSLIMPGIIHEEDFVDKVGLNIGRIFGDGEASKRKILTADNVNQDDNGLRELIKLGCYRSALNLTKRLLTVYGQGPGKLGHYCKHSPYSLQLWFTRITLLVRIREFASAGAEVDAFKEFDNVDMYYEFYSDSYGEGRKGSMVPFYFRLLAAEIPQYNRKFNETIDKLTAILLIVQQILTHLEGGLTEYGTETADLGQQEISLKIWKKREVRILYSLANASLFAKDYYNAFNVLTKLCRLDLGHEPQLKSAIARLFLQHGDLVSAQKYFQESSELRSLESESDQVDTLIDSALTAIAQSSYAEALSLYKQALILQPENFTILNNMVVCLLYMGKLKESLLLMEGTVRQNTPQSLQENVLLNLSSIYELENTDGHKKHSLLKLISEYKGDGVNLASLKLTNLI